MDEVLTTIIDARVSEGHAEDWDFDGFWSALKQVPHLPITVDDSRRRRPHQDHSRPDREGSLRTHTSSTRA